MADLEGFEEQLRPELAAREARTARLVEEVYRVDGRYGDQIAAHRRATCRRRCRYAPPPTRTRARGADPLLRDRRRRATAWPTTSRGSRTRTRRSTRSTASSRTTSTRAASRAPGKRIVFYVNHEKTESLQRLAEAAAWFEARMPWDPKWRRSDVVGVTARAIDVVVETGEAGPMTAIGINLPNDQRIRETLRQQVRVARQHQRGLREVAAAGVPARVLLVGGGSRARGEVGRDGERGDDGDSRSAGARIGPRRRAPGRAAAARAEGAVLGHRRSARRSGRAVLRAGAEDRRDRPACRRSISPRSCWPSTKPTRATRWCSCGACARARRSKKTTCATAR